MAVFFFFFSSRRRHTRWNCDWSSDVCSSDLLAFIASGSLTAELIQPIGWSDGGAMAFTNSDGSYYLKDRKSTRLNSSHSSISYAVFCLKKKTNSNNKNSL